MSSMLYIAKRPMSLSRAHTFFLKKRLFYFLLAPSLQSNWPNCLLNGRAERKHRHIMETLRALLLPLSKVRLGGKLHQG